MTIKTILLGTACAAAAMAAPAQAAQGDVLVRLRGIMVAPNENSGSVLPGFPGEKVKVNNTITPEIDITYMATDNIGFELIAATTAKLSIQHSSVRKGMSFILSLAFLAFHVLITALTLAS